MHKREYTKCVNNKKILIFALFFILLPCVFADSVVRRFHFNNSVNFPNIVYNGTTVFVNYTRSPYGTPSSTNMWAVEQNLSAGWNTSEQNVVNNKLNFYTTGNEQYFNFIAPKNAGDFIFNGSYWLFVHDPDIYVFPNQYVRVVDCTPITEICDGIDNDCDYLIDEGLSAEDCGLICTNLGYNYNPSRIGNLRCCGNDAGEDSPYQTPAETSCSDSRDNDCDGNIDGADSDCSGTCTNTGEDDWTVVGQLDCNQCDYDNDNDGDQPGNWAPYPNMADRCDSDCGTVSATIQLSQYQVSETSCDGMDNDCDGTIDENLKTNYYRDYDGDGYGNPAVMQSACNAPTGYVANDQDCNDNDDIINPDASEDCDGIDNNCRNGVDEGFTNETCSFICTGLGYNYNVARTGNLRCCGNDIHEDSPYQTTETSCSDGNDNDCDGNIDGADSNCVAPGCQITSIGWNIYSANEGSNVGITLVGNSYCVGKAINVTVMERDNEVPLFHVLNGDDITQSFITAFSTSLSWTAIWQEDELGDPEYYIMIKVDENEFNSPLDSGLLSVRAVSRATETRTIPLSSGKNSFSLPLLLEDMSINSVFGSAAANIDKIYTYDNGWKIYHADSKPSNLNILEAGKGYIVVMKSPGTISISGSKRQQDLQRPNVQLDGGWNLAGTFSIETQERFILSDILSDIESIYLYNETTGSYQKIESDTKVLEEDKAYWVYLKQSRLFVPRTGWASFTPSSSRIPTYNQFFGNIRYSNGSLMDKNVVVSAYFNGTQILSSNSQNERYGYSDLLFAQNLENGDTVEFYINSGFSANSTFSNEATTQLDLTYKCGNSIVDAGEDCDSNDLAGKTCLNLGFVSGTLKCGSSCLFDTSSCVSNTGGTGGSGGGGSSRPNVVVPLVEEEACSERWVCSSWQPSVCPASEVQTRTCEEVNKCGTSEEAPELTKTCDYRPSATCSDGIQNQGESGVDCGGPCNPCELFAPQNEIKIEEKTKGSAWVYIGIIAIFLMIAVGSGGLVLFEKNRHKKDFDDMPEYERKPLLNLERYVQQMIKTGYNEQQIRDAIIKVGWRRDLVDHVFEKIRNN